MEKINIGISISARKGADIWANGINQNFGLLGALLRKSPAVGKVWFLNGGDAESLPLAMDFDRLGIPLVRPHQRELKIQPKNLTAEDTESTENACYAYL